jgi:hypothetical protein
MQRKYLITTGIILSALSILVVISYYSRTFQDGSRSNTDHWEKLNGPCIPSGPLLIGGMFFLTWS